MKMIMNEENEGDVVESPADSVCRDKVANTLNK